jgi:hypothetical protein
MYCAVGTDSEDCAVNITQGNCAWTNDGNCDDGSTGGNVICALGTDEPDCGRAAANATNSCEWCERDASNLSRSEPKQ